VHGLDGLIVDTSEKFIHGVSYGFVGMILSLDLIIRDHALLPASSILAFSQ